MSLDILEAIKEARNDPDGTSLIPVLDIVEELVEDYLDSVSSIEFRLRSIEATIDDDEVTPGLGVGPLRGYLLGVQGLCERLEKEELSEVCSRAVKEVLEGTGIVLESIDEAFDAPEGGV